jgi:hypothetical protein
MSVEDQNNDRNPLELWLTVAAIIYNLLVLLFAMIWIFSPNLGAIKMPVQIEILPDSPTHNLIAFFACGAIGGASYCLKSIYERLSDAYTPNPAFTPPALIGKPPREIFNINIWIFWYLYRPIQSGVLAAVVAGLISMGLLSFNGTGTGANLNSIYFQLGLGFLVGYGTHEVLKKIEEIISVLFARKAEGGAPSPTVPKPRDHDDPQPPADPRNGESKPPASGSPAAGSPTPGTAAPKPEEPATPSPGAGG